MRKAENVIDLIPIALDRTGCELSGSLQLKMAEDICKEFPKVKIDVIKSAMRKGGLGYFGSTYKLTTQEVCIWIREEIIYRQSHNSDGTPKPIF